jgi:hypothetical protein
MVGFLLYAAAAVFFSWNWIRWCGRHPEICNANHSLTVIQFRITTPVVMGLIYFGVFAPMGFIMRIARHNVLIRRVGEDGYWIRRKTERDQANSLEHQF